MNHHAFLIKEAVTTGALAAIAKRHGIPLIGDWRYAAKLLHKGQRATPSGKKHYGKVLGFMDPEERAIVGKAMIKSPEAEVAILTPAQKKPRRVITGDESEVTTGDPKGMRRILHTHPGEVSGPAFRNTSFGAALPSSGLDTGDMPTDVYLGLAPILQKIMENPKEFNRWLRLTGEANKGRDNPRFPSGLSEAISSLFKGTNYGPMRSGDYRMMLRAGGPPTSVIFAPGAGTQSVSKMKQGPLKRELRRLYLKGGERMG
jgi:hypothetical protein